MNRLDLLTYIAVIIVAGMVILNAAIAASPAAFNLFAKGGSHEVLVIEQKRWVFESTVWTAMFSLTILAIFFYLYHLRRYAERFKS